MVLVGGGGLRLVEVASLWREGWGIPRRWRGLGSVLERAGFPINPDGKNRDRDGSMVEDGT